MPGTGPGVLRKTSVRKRERIIRFLSRPRDKDIHTLGDTPVTFRGTLRFTLWLIHLFEWKDPSRIITALHEYKKKYIKVRSEVGVRRDGEFGAGGDSGAGRVDVGGIAAGGIATISLAVTSTGGMSGIAFLVKTMMPTDGSYLPCGRKPASRLPTRHCCK